LIEAPTGGGVANVERIADRQKGQTAALFGQQADRCPAGDLRKGLKARGKPKKIAT
jgi:hypothetical protein